MRLTHGPGSHTVTAAGYLLQLPGGQPAATLADPDGRIWSRLSLLASVDRTDLPDESYDIGEPRVSPGRCDGEDVVEIEVACRSTAWSAKSVLLRCFEDRIEVTARVEGTGTLGEVRLLGGRAFLSSGACGTFRSSVGFASVFNPTPTEPIQVVRAASAGVALGIVGDASAGRLHGIFSPPPLCLAFGREPAGHATHVPAGGWLSAGLLAAVDDLRFTELRYAPLDDGFLLELDYDGHTEVSGEFVTPTLVLRPAADPWVGLAAYRADLVERGFAPAGPATTPADWWTEPIFCGWGAQCAAARVPDLPTPRSGYLVEPGPAVVPDVLPVAFDLARQDRYDGWLGRLAEHGVVPGTVVVDDRWQLAYGTAEPDPERWPDLRGWIAERHAAGQRVLLWWKAWDPTGLPVPECVTDPGGTPVAADPGSPGYLGHLTDIVTRLLGPDGLDADGFKVDFTQRAPAGRGLRRPGAPPDAPWGIAALHRMLATLYQAAKAAKPDALVVTHTPHPGFGDVCDMIRLNDILERDPRGAIVPAVDQLAFRHAVVAASLPGHLVDTDQWPIADVAQWRSYVMTQSRLGVPALYYADRIDQSGEELTGHDLALVASTWRDYRASRTASAERGATSSSSNQAVGTLSVG
ncbi:hypothetical protein GCM10022225_71900 [Plantactinospora mayteni]|uniref:Glycoside hydrolase n=1 Tax=Plantactinospora mayteni TaxID=566021 RepID=A0ABQ4F148_9ACTN|nr:hypothetical protein [Plantactinospora mayteni]GIH00644.1 hypothetical protein Pma05_72160 [Plantactinospora mayteni]